MSILVIGGTGMVGGHVVRGLLTKGEAVHVLTRSADKADIIPLGANDIIGDLHKPETLRKVPGYLLRCVHTFVRETVAAWMRDGSREYVTMG
jgi:uncharacterized protein YbjT (DUF2867 family)